MESTTWENTAKDTLVFKDQAGEYYLLPQETLEQGRVPAEHKAEIEHLLAEQHDVQGHLFWVHIARTAAVLVAGAVTVIREGTKDEPGTMTNAQFVQQVIDQGRR